MPEQSVVIRAAREGELPLVSALEKSGDGLFRAAGMDRVADAAAPEPGAYRPALHDGRLLAAGEQLARARGHCRMTLTTFRDVPWNGPYYARLGWSALPEAGLPPELAAARQHERDLGLDQWPRQAMMKNL
jgi:hypothetical protein